MENLFRYFDQFTQLNARIQEVLSGLIEEVHLPKKHLLFEQGSICKDLYFIEKGAARIFYVKDGKDVTTSFGFEGRIVSAFDSIFSRNPSNYNIELLEDSKIYKLHFPDVENLFNNFPQIERLWRNIITDNFMLVEERLKLLQFNTAKEKYDQLLNQVPDIINRVSVTHLASYLGVAQETLSRIRAKF
ncbi:cAMP-binding domain of CRP or a regulatory subunit of cAMP-dependent protein kinases [Pseudarcicella hirudinis]|uniref:cAMP-binding domain of CRP or a regulatory subunit of cAMP-dependent protein kinases n=1 Tax=Pseudarcicella hirudinis TaxID=1079859 RepID=A0A1I5UXM6_9BACT|nr:Crp/Fnr family transcriptional regulator [Pseudarcicella hirudinis]SFP99991.1 cAMP-binding domain of CRP or a regulatory subunit of cAMP-dependent protein kinases [Pseudarcicella hirudinis]